MLTACIITQACAATTAELEEQVSACQEIKDKAHEMAECARFLGFDEGSVIIQTAKEKWMEAYTEELNLMEQIEAQKQEEEWHWDGSILTKSKGVNYGPSGKETYYNLPMQGVVRIMRNIGFSEADYPYWVRDDGCKMLGDYIIVAANLSVHPRGSVVQTSRGRGLVCDTGGFAKNNPYQLDLACAW